MISILKIVDSGTGLVQPSMVSNAHHLLACVLRVANLVEQRLEHALEPTGLSLAKLGALRHLAEAQEPLALGQLAERIACVKSNVTQLVDRLEAEGLVKRVPDPDDRRSVRAALTDLGMARYRAGEAAVIAAEAALVDELDPPDRDLLFRLLGQLTPAEAGN
ncbi:MAG TPA: MarR family transcriptional regulator [Longimicrobiales bacterium]